MSNCFLNVQIIEDSFDSTDLDSLLMKKINDKIEILQRQEESDKSDLVSDVTFDIY
jgi:hypothetical protein